MVSSPYLSNGMRITEFKTSPKSESRFRFAQSAVLKSKIQPINPSLHCELLLHCGIVMGLFAGLTDFCYQGLHHWRLACPTKDNPMKI